LLGAVAASGDNHTSEAVAAKLRRAKNIPPTDAAHDGGAQSARDAVAATLNNPAASGTSEEVQLVSAHKAARMEITDAFREKMHDHRAAMSAVLDNQLQAEGDTNQKDALARERRQLEDKRLEDVARARDAVARKKAADEKTSGYAARKAVRDQEAAQAVDAKAAATSFEKAPTDSIPMVVESSWRESHSLVAQYRLQRQSQESVQRQREYEASEQEAPHLEDVLGAKQQAKVAAVSAAEPDRGPAHWFEITGQLEKLALKEQARREQGTDRSAAGFPRALQPIAGAFAAAVFTVFLS